MVRYFETLLANVIINLTVYLKLCNWIKCAFMHAANLTHFCGNSLRPDATQCPNLDQSQWATKARHWAKQSSSEWSRTFRNLVATGRRASWTKDVGDGSLSNACFNIKMCSILPRACNDNFT